MFAFWRCRNTPETPENFAKKIIFDNLILENKKILYATQNFTKKRKNE